MKKLKEVLESDLDKSLMTHTEYVPLAQNFDVSIGFSEKVQLPNADRMVEEEYKRDLELYKRLKE